MPITAPLLKATLRWSWMSQAMQTTRYFKPTGAAFLTATALGVAEAYWNHVKTVWRAIAPAGGSDIFSSVILEEVGGGQTFAEYAIPAGERVGTRSVAGSGTAIPSYNACGIRFAVGSRVTRPGQMRVPFLYEGDTYLQQVDTAYLALTNALAAVYAADMTLGAPVATGVLRMQVVRWTKTVPAAVEAQQDVVGYVVDVNMTTQRSRRIGHGS